MVEKGTEQSAILMFALGESEAANVFKLMNHKEVKSIGLQMAQIKEVTQERLDEIMIDFLDAADKQSGLGANSSAYIRSVLTQALGDEKAGFLLDSILVGSDTSGIESLKWMDAETVAEMIKDEHPQIITTIMVHLERDHAATIINHFPEGLRSEIMLRIATLDGVQPAALQELNDVLSRLLSGGEKLRKRTLGGVRTAAEILNYVGASSEKSVIESISKTNRTLSEQIQEEMFTFENILGLDDKDFRKVLPLVPEEMLLLSLKSTSSEIKEKFFRNMSKRAAEDMAYELQMMSGKRLSEIEQAQKDILRIIRSEADKGNITLKTTGDEFV